MLKTSGLKIFKLEYLIYLTIFCLPAYLIRFNLFGLALNALDCLLFAVIALSLTKIRPNDAAAFFREHKLLSFSIALLLLGFLISAFSNPGLEKGLGIIKSWLVLPILFAFFVSRVLAKEKYPNVLLAYFYSALAVALVSLGYLLANSLTYDGRLSGFFNSPNYLAMYLAPGIIIGVLLLGTQKFSERSMLLGFVAILIPFFFTYSYASWSALFLSLAIAVFIRRSTKKLTFGHIGVLLAGFLLLAMLFFSQIHSAKLQTLVARDSRSSLASRVMIWQSSAMMLEESWLRGIGPGNFQARYLDNQKYFAPYLEWAVPHPHNIFLAFWLYGGILGLVAFAGILWFWLKASPALGLSRLGTACLAIMLYVLLHGLLDTTYFKNDLAVVFWLNFIFLL